MSYLKSILLLVASRGMALAGFFLLQVVALPEDFKNYALYFAIWQFGSQLVSLQLGTTLFRCGIKPVFSRNINSLLAFLYYILGVILILFMVLALLGNVLIAAVAMSVIAGLFVIVSEYARAKMNERLVFAVYMLPGALYLLLYLGSYLLSSVLSLKLLLLAECGVYVLMIIFLLLKCEVKAQRPTIRLLSVARRIYPFWRKMSRPLIANNLLWYFYFNAPIIIGYNLLSDVSEYNEMALLFRFVVAISTVSSMLALVFQKKIINLFEHDFERYKKIKCYFKNIFVPGFFIVSTLFIIAAHALRDFIQAHISCSACTVAFDNVGIFMFLFFIFLSVYLMSHYFVAEKDMKVISPSMIAGFVVYLIAVITGVTAGLSFSPVSIYALCISLCITFIIRYTWLFKHKEKL